MLYFIIGILFISYIIPLFDGLASLYNQFIQYICTIIAVKTYKQKENIEEKEDIQSIGFDLSSNELNDQLEESLKKVGKTK